MKKTQNSVGSNVLLVRVKRGTGQPQTQFRQQRPKLGAAKQRTRAKNMAFTQLQEDPTLLKLMVSPQSLGKVSNIAATTVLWNLEVEYDQSVRTACTDLSESKEEELKQILEEFSVFKEPKGLPPSREVDHKISTKLGVDLVNVIPYRF